MPRDSNYDLPEPEYDPFKSGDATRVEEYDPFKSGDATPDDYDPFKSGDATPTSSWARNIVSNTAKGLVEGEGLGLSGTWRLIDKTLGEWPQRAIISVGNRLGFITDKAADVMKTMTDKGIRFTPEQTRLHKAAQFGEEGGKAVQDLADYYTPDPARQHEFTQQVARGAGQLGSVVMSPETALPTMMAQMGETQYNQALAEGDPEAIASAKYDLGAAEGGLLGLVGIKAPAGAKPLVAGLARTGGAAFLGGAQDVALQKVTHPEKPVDWDSVKFNTIFGGLFGAYHGLQDFQRARIQQKIDALPPEQRTQANIDRIVAGEVPKPGTAGAEPDPFAGAEPTDISPEDKARNEVNAKIAALKAGQAPPATESGETTTQPGATTAPGETPPAPGETTTPPGQTPPAPGETTTPPAGETTAPGGTTTSERTQSDEAGAQKFVDETKEERRARFAARDEARTRWIAEARRIAPGLMKYFDLKFGDPRELVKSGKVKPEDLNGFEQAYYDGQQKLLYLFDKFISSVPDYVTRINLLHEMGHAHWDTLTPDRQSALAEQWRTETGQNEPDPAKRKGKGPLFDSDGNRRKGVAQGVETDIKEWYAERVAQENHRWAEARAHGSDATSNSLIGRSAAAMRGALESMRGFVQQLRGNTVNTDFRSFLDQGKRFETPGESRPSESTSEPTRAFARREETPEERKFNPGEFLAKAVKDPAENLRRKFASRPGTGDTQNKQIRLEDKEGKPIYMGGTEETGHKAFDAVIEENEKWLSKDEVGKFRQWYTELPPKFKQEFGPEDGPKMLTAWLAAQQNVSVGGAMQNVFKAQDALAGIGTGLKAGLADEKVKAVLTGTIPEQGFAGKLSDFVDAGTGNPHTRTYMGHDPRGGKPFVGDVWSGRDSGHIDSETINRLVDMHEAGNLFIDGKPVKVEVTGTKTVTTKDANGKTKTKVVPTEAVLKVKGRKPIAIKTDLEGSPSGPKYERVSEWGNKLTDHLNAKNWMGGNWTPSEVQAVGWMRTLRQYGRPEGTLDSAFRENTHRVYAEVNYSSGSFLPKNFPKFGHLAPDVQRAITSRVLERMMPRIIEHIGGSLRLKSMSIGDGVWDGVQAPSMAFEIMGSPEAVDMAALALAHVSEQGGTMSVVFGKGGKNSRALTFGLADGTRMTDAQLKSLIEAAKVKGLSYHQLPDGAKGMITGPNGFSESRAVKVGKALMEWAHKTGVGLDVKEHPASITSYENNWASHPNGEEYISALKRGGIGERISGLDGLRRAYRSELAQAFEQHAPESGAPESAARAEAAEPVKPATPPTGPPTTGPEASGAFARRTETPEFKRWFGDSKVTDEQGQPKVVFHGTTADIHKFRDDKASPEGDMGAGFYFTNNPDDAGTNYHIAGMDLQNKLTNLAEQLHHGENYTEEQARTEAARRIGIEHQGATLPVYLKMENPVQLGGEHPTYLEGDPETGTGPLFKFVDSLRTLAEEHGGNGDRVASDILDRHMEGGRVDEIIKTAKHSEGMMDVQDSEGRLVISDVIRQALQHAGFDGVIDHTVHEKWGRKMGRYGATGMEHVNPDTTHYIVFDPTQVKSAIGNRGTFDANDPRIAFARRVSSEHEQRSVGDRMRDAADNIGGFLRREFTSRGGLPENVFQARVARDGRLNAVKQAMAFTIKDLNKGVLAVYGGYRAIPEADQAKINAVLHGTAPVSSVDPRLQQPLAEMRRQVDVMSRRLVREGVVKGDLAAKISANEGFYLNRSYAKFDDPNWSAKVHPDVVNKASSFLRQEMRQEMLDQAADATVRQQGAKKIDRTDPAWLAARAQHDANPTIQPDESHVQGMVEHLLNKDGPQETADLHGGGNADRKDLSILTRRGDIAPEIRDLLGEYKDPRVNYARSVGKMAQVLEAHRFLSEARTAGMGKYFFNEPRPGASTRISAEGSKAMAPLDGLFTSPEIADALKRNMDERKSNNPAWNAFLGLNGWVKIAKTVYSPVTQVRNFTANLAFLVANGHYHAIDGGAGILSAIRGELQGITAKGQPYRAGQAYLTRLARLGIVGESANAGEMREALKHAGFKMTGIEQWTDGRIMKAAKAPFRVAARIYQMNDEIFKIYAFENELRNFQKALPGAPLETVERLAAERVHNTLPTYSRVPLGVQRLRRAAVVGSFTSWPAEVVRTGYHTLNYATADIRSANPAIRAMGARRLAGMAAVIGLFPAVSMMSRKQHGWNQQDEKDLRRFLPDWTKNSEVMHTSENHNGKASLVDLSYLDPWAYMRKPVLAALNGENWQDAIGGAAVEMVTPFLGEGVLSSVLLDLTRNKDANGRPVYDENADPLTRQLQKLQHVWQAAEPGFMTQARRMVKASKGEVSATGHAYNPEDELLALTTGARSQSIDVATAHHFQTGKFAGAMSLAQVNYLRARNRPGADPDEVAAARDTFMNQRTQLIEEMYQNTAAAERLGVSKAQIFANLKASGLSGPELVSVMTGKVFPYVDKPMNKYETLRRMLATEPAAAK